MTILLTHPDEVSCVAVLSDGTRVFCGKNDIITFRPRVQTLTPDQWREYGTCIDTGAWSEIKAMTPADLREWRKVLAQERRRQHAQS